MQLLINIFVIILNMKNLLLLPFVVFVFKLQSQRIDKPIEILLLGTFHFDNPGLDVAQFKNADVLSPKRQAEILDVVAKLKKFNPDKIYIEYTPDSQSRTDSLIAEYKKGTYTLKANETNQLGYRLAKDLNLPTLYHVDYRDADFPFDSLMKSAAAAGQINIIEYVQKAIDSIQKSFNTSLDKMTIGQLLIDANKESAIKDGVGFYYRLLPVGIPGNHVGSYLVSEWWRRNMIIYENMLKSIHGNEKRIVVLFGSGHTALLHEMIKYNSDFKIIKVSDVLK